MQEGGLKKFRKILKTFLVSKTRIKTPEEEDQIIYKNKKQNILGVASLEFPRSGPWELGPGFGP